MNHTCTHCSSVFTIPEEDRLLLERLSPTFSGIKHSIPLPTFCSQCRFQRRLSFRNAKHLYRRKSDLSGKQIVSMYSANKPYLVYDQDEWWGDSWDALSFGREFDFNKTFAEQFSKLNTAVPHMSLNTKNVENSYYTNFTLNQKNCYLIFGGANNEDCFYGYFVSSSKDCVDCLSIFNCELCYEGIASEGCYNCQYFLNCRHCTDCFLVEECSSCSNCMLCFGLHRKEYHYLNEPVGKKRYEEIKKDLENLTSARLQELKNQFANLKKTLPHRASKIYASETCSGDMIFQSKNCHTCFDTLLSEDCKYLCFSPRCLNSMDATFNSPEGVELCYEVCSTVGSLSSMATFHSWYNHQTYYSIECHNCKNLFGCVGLKFKEYCILNKEYSPAEYEKKVSQIISHMKKTNEWGEFFPTWISLFGYNETIAAEYFPLTKSEVLQKKWTWHEKEEKLEGDEVLQSNKTLHCKVSKKPYKLTPQEIAFYQRLNIPHPEECFDVRHEKRQQQRTPRKLWKRSCSKCSAAIETTYAENRPETVYCDRCYYEFFY